MVEVKEEAKTDAQKITEAKKPEVKVPLMSSVSRFFTRPIPWWVLFAFVTYFMLKSQDVYFNSPCAVLGMNEPLSNAVIKKKFRNISMCTHPDRLRGRLGRVPTEAEVRRGMVLFNRASKAKDSLTDALKSAETSRERRNKRREKKGLPPLEEPEIYCQEGDFDKRIFRQIKDTWEYVNAIAKVEMGQDPAAAYGKVEVVYYFLKQLASEIVNAYYDAITFTNGVMSSLLLLLWTLFLYRMLRSFFEWLYKIGIIRLPFEIVRGVLISPFPTAFRFIVLIPLRFYVFLRTEAVEWRQMRKEKVDEDRPNKCVCENCLKAKIAEKCDCANCKAKKTADAEEDADAAESLMPSSSGIAVTGSDDQKLRMRKRLAKGKEEQRAKEKLKEEQEKLVTAAEKDAEDDDSGTEAADENAEKDGLIDIVSRRVKGKEMIARAVGVSNVQVEMLIVLTKPVLPLLMVIFTGQVWSGLIMSMLMWEVMRKVPKFHYEVLHLMCVLFGFLHTWVGVTPQEIESRAGGSGVQKLEWEWDHRDCIFILFLSISGALAQSFSRLGNEPYFTSSFGSGVVLRMLLTTDFVQDIGLVQYVSEWTTDFLRSVSIEVTTSDDMVTYSGGGIGGCGGGVYEMFVGEEYAYYVSLVAKILLMALPLLTTMMWIVRALKGIHVSRSTKFSAVRRFPRIVYRSWLAAFGVVQLIFLATLSFNEAHGGMTSFWLTVMIGVIFESFLSTYDIRGPMRSLIFVFIFALS